MLQIKNLNKHYGKKQALFDFEMTFKNGVYGLFHQRRRKINAYEHYFR